MGYSPNGKKKMIDKDYRLDLYNFQKWLKKNYGEQTQADYMSKMESLKNHGITEVSTSTEIVNTIVDLCKDFKGNASGRMYKSAVVAYQRFKNEVFGERLNLIDNIGRIRLEETFPREQVVRPPKKGLYLYKFNIPRCPNDSMKFAMMLQLNAGLRVGEATSLNPQDITLGKNNMDQNTVWLNIDPNKTQYGRKIRVLRLPDLFDADELYELAQFQLKKGLHLPKTADIQQYMAGLDKENEDPGGESHDLRKYCARALYRNERLSGKNKVDASEVVRKQLGHRKKEYTIGETRGDGGYLGKVWLEDKGGKYQDSKIDWKTP